MTDETVLERTSNLVMPSHYVELNEDEMSYVEGGGISRESFATGIDVALVGLSLVCTVVGAAITVHTLAKIGKGLIGNILKREAKKALKSMIKSCWRTFGFTTLSAALGAADSLAGIFFDFSVGGLIAHLIDYADGNYNGICFG